MTLYTHTLDGTTYYSFDTYDNIGLFISNACAKSRNDEDGEVYIILAWNFKLDKNLIFSKKKNMLNKLKELQKHKLILLGLIDIEI